MLSTDGKSDGVGLDTLKCQFFLGILGVCCGCRMDGKGLNICYICKEREDLKLVDESLCLLCAALDLKCEDRSTAVGIVLLVELLL